MSNGLLVAAGVGIVLGLAGLVGALVLARIDAEREWDRDDEELGTGRGRPGMD